jgi:hypothetical protein
MKKFIAISTLAILALSACEDEQNAREADEDASEDVLRTLQRAHPVPSFERSQYRQNLVEIITAQANTTATTSFFFNQGVQDPIHSCPSVGFPIPSTAQLTNPDQISHNSTVISQVEPSGVFTGDSTGTYAICIDAEGEGYAVYWEGFVQAVTGPAEWNIERHTVELIGASSFDFSEDAG